jgi:hypothetical protein
MKSRKSVDLFHPGMKAIKPGLSRVAAKCSNHFTMPHPVVLISNNIEISSIFHWEVE